jgi:hypothetical protein
MTNITIYISYSDWMFIYQFDTRVQSRIDNTPQKNRVHSLEPVWDELIYKLARIAHNIDNVTPTSPLRPITILNIKCELHESLVVSSSTDYVSCSCCEQLQRQRRI